LYAPAIKSVSRVAPKATRPMSTILDNKERAEESRYIKSMEAAREAEMRKNLERIMALEAHHDEKKELVELLSGKKEEKKGAVELLSDWKFALPVGLMVGIPAVLNEVIVIGPEFQLTACFILFCSTMYTQVGPMLSKVFEDRKNAIKNELSGLDELFTSEVKEMIEFNKSQLEIVQEYKDYCEVVDAMGALDAQNKNNKFEQEYHEQIVKKLESLHVLEENAVSAIRARTVSAVKNDVVKLFSEDKKAKENALNAAIAILAQGQGGKLGKDIVGDAFTQSLTTYRENYAKADPKSDSILVKLEKDIEAIASAPIISMTQEKNLHPFA